MSIKSLVFILLVAVVAVSQAIICIPEKCDGVIHCPMDSREDCEQNQNGVYLERNPGLCRCCAMCVRKINEGEDCTLSLIRDAQPVALCAPGLLCDSQTKTCVKRAVCDNC